MKKYIISLFLCLIGFVSPVLSQPNITISPTTVAYGNPIIVTFSDSETIETLPDLSMLQKNFMIRGQNQSAQTRIYNGIKTSEYYLKLTVFPHKIGTFEIGPFQWKNKHFPAQTVTVQDAPVSAVQGQGTNVSQNVGQVASNAVFKLETMVENPSVYIGETTIYKIRLYNNIGLMQPQLELPFSDDYTLTPYGKEQLVQTTMDGQRVWLYERMFLLSPKKTGEIVISQASVFGSIPDTTAPRHRVFGDSMFHDMFGDDPFFNMTIGLPQKEVYKQSNLVQLTVKEKPADWQGWWLPTKELSLTEDYKTTTVNRVGEPIERRIQLKALGVEGHQLPLLTQSANDSFKVYANPEKRSQISMNNTIVGYEEIAFVIVPMKSGEITIPPISVEWFNTTTEKKEITTLPSKTFFVAEAETIAGSVNIDTTSADKTDMREEINSSDTLSDEQKTQTSTNVANDVKIPQNVTDNSVWLYIGVGTSVILAFFLGCVGYWLGRRKQIKTLVQSTKTGHKKKQKKKPVPDLYPF